jgi:hypothetical protein
MFPASHGELRDGELFEGGENGQASERREMLMTLFEFGPFVLQLTLDHA